MTTLFGGTYSTHAKRVAIWNAAVVIPGCDKAIWRCDDQGRIIRWSDYDDRFSRYGWTVVRERRESRLAKALGLASAKAVHVDQARGAEAQPFRNAA
jgi:hypothetical protein